MPRLPRGTEARAAAGLAGLAGLCVFALVALPNPHARLLLGAASLAPAQLGFIGGAGVEGGQGNSDSIYGSHDDHATFGVAGSGWQGPGNAEAPGDLWNPAVGPRHGIMGAARPYRVSLDLDGGDMPMPIDDNNPFPVAPGSNIHMFGGFGEPASPRDNPCARFSAQGMPAVFACESVSGRCGCVAAPPQAQLGFIGGAGVEGGQGNSDSIYGSHDDHATFGVAGSGWQGPGNGEAPGDLWNPAVGPRPHAYAGMKQQRRTAGAQGGLVSWFGGGRGLWLKTAFGLAGAPQQRLNMGDLPVPIGYDGDRDRVVPGSNIHMYEHGVPTTIPFDVDDLSPYVVPSYSDPNF